MDCTIRGDMGNNAAIPLLTITGRQSGETVPLIFVPDGDDYAIISSPGGRPGIPLVLKDPDGSQVELLGRPANR